MKKTAVLLILMLTLSKVFGFVRELTLSRYFGAEAISDAFLIASAIPVTIFGFVGTGLVNSFIPIYTEIDEESGRAKADKFLSNFVNVLLVVLIAFSILAFIFINPLVRLNALKANPETFALAVSFSRITIFGIAATALLSIFSGYLQVRQRFLVVPISGIVMNLVTIAFIIASDRTGHPILLAFGILVSTLAQLLIVLFFVKKEHYHHANGINFRDPKLQMLLVLSLPIIFGSSVDQINQMIDRTMASGFSDGAISLVNYANRINDSIIGLFVTSITSIFFPIIASLAVQKKMTKLKLEIKETINTIAVIVIPASLGLFFLSYPIARIAFFRNTPTAKMTLEDINMISIIMRMSAVGTLAFAIRQVFVRVFYSLKDSVRPVIYSAIGVGCNVILNLILGKLMGLPGLALATSLSAYISVFLLTVSLRKKIGPFNFKAILITMAFVAHRLYRFAYLSLHLSFIMSLGISVLVGVILYVVLMFFMNVDEYDKMLETVLRKLFRR